MWEFFGGSAGGDAAQDGSHVQACEFAEFSVAKGAWGLCKIVRT